MKIDVFDLAGQPFFCEVCCVHAYVYTLYKCIHTCNAHMYHIPCVENTVQSCLDLSGLWLSRSMHLMNYSKCLPQGYGHFAAGAFQRVPSRRSDPDCR